jgi:DNA-dependent RNA polymerase auxiliary subunit epsilon
MTKEPVDTLYVNMSASQVRKRLKGHGYGVKQIEATDRKQAAITHTATGDHFRSLLALFADVDTSTDKSDLDRLRDDRPEPLDAMDP